MSQGKELPQVIEKTPEEIEAAIALIKNSNLPDSTKQFVIACIRLAIWLPNALLEKKISLFNLRKLIFGRGKSNKRGTNTSNKTSNDLAPEPPEAGKSDKNPITPDTSPDDKNHNNMANQDPNDTKPNDKNEKTPAKPGHGRHGHDVYSDAIEHHLQINGLSAGDLCPGACGGKLYQYTPGILVRIKGQHWASVHKYHVEKLRCSLCGELVLADIPDEIGTEKYDATFKAILAIQKYYIAIPFYRQAYFQLLMKMPLAPSTQWELVEKIANSVISVFKELEKVAANGEVIHGDDSHLKILEVINDNKKNPDKTRTGMFTTGVLSKFEDKQISLFYNGTEHAGENMASATRSYKRKLFSLKKKMGRKPLMLLSEPRVMNKELT